MRYIIRGPVHILIETLYTIGFFPNPKNLDWLLLTYFICWNKVKLSQLLTSNTFITSGIRCFHGNKHKHWQYQFYREVYTWYKSKPYIGTKFTRQLTVKCQISPVNRKFSIDSIQPWSCFWHLVCFVTTQHLDEISEMKWLLPVIQYSTLGFSPQTSILSGDEDIRW